MRVRSRAAVRRPRERRKAFEKQLVMHCEASLPASRALKAKTWIRIGAPSGVLASRLSVTRAAPISVVPVRRRRCAGRPGRPHPNQVMRALGSDPSMRPVSAARDTCAVTGLGSAG